MDKQTYITTIAGVLSMSIVSSTWGQTVRTHDPQPVSTAATHEEFAAPLALGFVSLSGIQVPVAAESTPDSIYRLARQELNRGNYRRAGQLFRQLRTQHENSQYTPDTYYWEAFALYRTGDIENLREGIRLLDAQARRYSGAETRRSGDAEELRVQIDGALAQRGDAQAAESVTERARGQGGCPREEDDVRVMALNALLNMDAERAVPILESVLERRDACSVELRRKAVWLISQKRSDNARGILLDVVRNDPDKEVREQAVFWLSQVRGDETVAALNSILMESTDEDIQEKAIFALSNHRNARAGEILRRYAERSDAPENLREKAIFWLGQRRGGEDQQFLRDLYGRVESEGVKEKIIFAVSQHRSEAAGQWLLDIALDPNESVDLRKSALFWAGQKRTIPVADLGRLYDTMNEREMQEQVIFVLSQRKEPEAVDALMDIARNEQDTDLQKKAIFWLGQSKDPRVAQFLLDLINRD